MSEKITLVNIDDAVIGYCDKMQAHKEAKLHRAFSIFIYGYKNNDLCILLQKRAVDKYHSGGLWTNACCSHPNIDETLEQAVQRRLKEELNICMCPKEIFSFLYFCRYTKECTEYEWDHVFCGKWTEDVKPNPEEIDEIRWMPISELKEKLEKKPDKFTVWFITAISQVLDYIIKEEKYKDDN